MIGLNVSKQELSSEDHDAANEDLDNSISAMPFNPTAENIASFVGETVCPTVLSGTGVEVIRVVVHETPNCFATWEAK